MWICFTLADKGTVVNQESQSFNPDSLKITFSTSLKEIESLPQTRVFESLKLCNQMS